MAAGDRSKRLQDFSKWCATHIKGDEKGEAQIFLDNLFKAFGWPGLLEAGARCEERIKNDDGGTSFADLVWKPVVLVEMKKRGVKLEQHYRQAFDYWSRLVPNRPRYAILCNFDELWIYDFETQMDIPVDRVKISELSDRYGPLNFLFPGEEAPIFGNHHEKVTRAAADKLAQCFTSLVNRGVNRKLAQSFTLQMMMALFSESIGLLEKYIVIKLLDECRTPKDSYDFIGGLFEAMSSDVVHTGGRYAGVPYFNGGLFKQPARIELNAKERSLLKDAAEFNWSQVRPEIFGTLFEHSLEKDERHALGAHFTNIADIMKIVGPTIVQPWRERIEAANTLRDLRALLVRIQKFTVFDPACGSGNFLYAAYRELKRLEADIYKKMSDNFPKSVDPNQRVFGFVTTRNFYGMDVNEFAVDIAKVTMMLAHKLAIDEFHINENALPLDNLDDNFIKQDALVRPDGSKSKWFKADVIIGNPPFLGAKRLKVEHSAEYVNRVRRAYKDVPGMADLCVYWIRRTQDELPRCTIEDPVAGRAGLVGTQNIRNNKSRVGGLDHVVSDGTIVEAVDNQPWSGEAAVHVSIVNWIKTKEKSIVPKKKLLWSEVSVVKTSAPKRRRRKGEEKLPKRFDLTFKEVAFINSSLSDRTDVSSANILSCNAAPQKSFQGVTPGYDGFVLSAESAQALLKSDKNARHIIRPYMIGRELNGKETRPKRFIIDLFNKDLADLTAWPKIFGHLKSSVYEKVKEKLSQEKKKQSDMVYARQEHLDRWWTFWAQRIDLRKWQNKHNRIVAASRTQREPFIFHFVDTKICFGDKLQLFAFDDDYSFGIIQSYAHCAWYKAKGARLKNEVDYNYSSREVFLTYPWPQSPSEASVKAVATAARAVREAREKALAAGTGMRALYATLTLEGKSNLKTAHAKLDEAVRAAYSFSTQKDVLVQLMELNQKISEALLNGVAVTLPGVPDGFDDIDELRSNDKVGT